MNKSEYDILSERSKTYYNSSINIIGDLYDGINSANDDLEYTKIGFYADFDAYLQAVLLKVCSFADNFSFDNMKFIEDIAEYGKLIDGTDLTLFADCVKDMRETLLEKADERLKEIPVSFKLAGAVDIKNGGYITKKMFDNIIRIAFILKSADKNANLKDNSDISAIVKPLYKFMSVNSIIEK